jgi:hypothetical protein
MRGHLQVTLGHEKSFRNDFCKTDLHFRFVPIAGAEKGNGRPVCRGRPEAHCGNALTAMKDFADDSSSRQEARRI